MQIIYNAFSFVREKLSQCGRAYLNVPFDIGDSMTVQELIKNLDLQEEDVEAVFVNHTVVPKTTPLHDGDRVALVPPGTPGSYRLMLGMKKVGV